jgi:hypothetical protein
VFNKESTVENEEFSRWFGVRVQLIGIEERPNISHAFLAEWRRLWWKPVPKGYGESILGIVDSDVLAMANVSTSNVVQGSYRSRFVEQGRFKTLEQDLSDRKFRNHRVVNVVQKPNGSYALVVMALVVHLVRNSRDFCREVTEYAYLEPVSEEVAQKVVASYVVAISSVRKRIKLRDLHERWTAFFGTINKKTPHNWVVPMLYSEEGNAGIAAYRDQHNAVARGMGLTSLKWNDTSAFGKSLLESELRGLNKWNDKIAGCVYSAMSYVSGIPEKVCHHAVTDVLLLTDGTHALRMFAKVNETHWSPGGDKRYDWKERDMLVPVPKTVALAAAKAVRAGLSEAADERRKELSQKELLEAMRHRLADRRLDANSITAARAAALVFQKLDPASVCAAQRAALLAQNFTEADIALLLGRSLS